MRTAPRKRRSLNVPSCSRITNQSVYC
ncbi:hypothetical protein NQ318_016378, partial [Aromia moschata]